MQIDNNVGEGLNAPAFWAKDKGRLAIINESPSCRQAKLALIFRKEARATPLWWYEVRRGKSGEESLYPWTLVADAKVESSKGRVPDDLAEPQSRRPPIVLDQAAGMVAAEPRREIIQLIPIGKDRRQADDTAIVCIGTPKESLNLHLVADLALVHANHVAFVEDKKADIIEQ